MIWLERLTFKTANFSIATNESYKQIAIKRGKMPADKVQVVRSGPSLERIRITPGNLKYKKGRTYLVGYVGVIGVQEGLDLLLEAVQHLVSKRQDVQFAIVGGGTSLEDIKKMSAEMGLEDYVDFYGRVSDEKLLDVLNTCDVCVNPDKPTVMNNLSTMNKIMEYMGLRKPIVQFDLKEGKASAEKASLYAKNDDTQDFAEKIMWLLDHEKESQEMAEYGYNRVINKLSWDHESIKLIDFYARVLNVKIAKPTEVLN